VCVCVCVCVCVFLCVFLCVCVCIRVRVRECTTGKGVMRIGPQMRGSEVKRGESERARVRESGTEREVGGEKRGDRQKKTRSKMYMHTHASA